MSSTADTAGPPGEEPRPGDAGTPADTAAGERKGTPADRPDSDGAPEGTPTAEDTDGTPAPGGMPAPVGPLPRRRLRRRILRIVAITTALLVVACAGAAYLVYRKLDNNIRTDENTTRLLGDVESERPKQLVTEATNILLIGSDDRGGANAKYGGGDGATQRSDTTILLHLSADREHATAVSIPRDLMARIPACEKPDGSRTRAQFAQFNWAFQFGGAACTIRTVEEMTGIRIDHHLIVDFTGFKKMVDAVGGVEICLPEPVKDQDALLDLPAGRQTVKGEDALAYVRARHAFGDGSDTGRIGRQQQFLASLVKKTKSTGVLLNPTKLYPLLNAATSSLTADPGLDSLSDLYNLARSLQRTPADNVAFLTVPREPYAYDHNRDQLVQPEADELFAALRNDRPVNVSASNDRNNQGDKEVGTASPTGGTEAKESPAGDPTRGAAGTPGASASPSASSTTEPSFDGTTANNDICGSS